MDEERVDPGGQKLRELLEKTPWWAISIALHAVVLLVLWGSVFSEQRPKSKPDIVIIMNPPQRIQPIDKDRMPIRRDPVELPAIAEATPDTIEEPAMIEDPLTEEPNDPLTEEFKEDADPGGGDPAELGLALIMPGLRPGKHGGPGGYGKDPFGRPPGGIPGPETRGGPPSGVQDIVDAGLKWLEKHQAMDGAWHADRWSDECPDNDGCTGKGEGQLNDRGESRPAAITGMALLAFLGNGHTHENGNYTRAVRNGLKYLKSIQDSDGRFRAPGKCDMYDHGIASLAVVEAYGMTRDRTYEKVAQKAIDYICKVQNPLGGWNYQSPNIRNDMSVSGWQMMALKSAKICKLEVPDEVIRKTVQWLDIGTNEENGGVCYAIESNDPTAVFAGGGGSVRMRAAGALGHMFFGKSPKDPVIQKDGDVFMKNLPAWNPADGDKASDLYYWYYASLASYQMQGKYWEKWGGAMESALINSQIKGGSHAKGSWAPIGQFSDKWSRPGSTALAVLCLEVYYRYRLVAR